MIECETPVGMEIDPIRMESNTGITFSPYFNSNTDIDIF